MSSSLRLTSEQLRVGTGPWRDLAQQLIDEYVTPNDGLSVTIKLDLARSRGLQNMCQALFSIAHLPNLVQATSLKLSKWVDKIDGPDPLLREKIIKTFRIFRDIAKDKELKVPLEQPARVAPIEFVTIAVLVAIFMERFSLADLSRAIHALRSEARKQHADIRTNSKVFKTISDTICRIPLTIFSQDASGSLAATAAASGSVSRGQSGVMDMDVDSDNDKDHTILPEASKRQPSPKPPTAPRVRQGSLHFHLPLTYEIPP